MMSSLGLKQTNNSSKETEKTTPEANMLTVNKTKAENFLIAFEEAVGNVEELKEIGGVEKITLGRELTKAHEEIISGTPEEIYASFKARDSIKGEFALVVVPFGENDDVDNKED